MSQKSGEKKARLGLCQFGCGTGIDKVTADFIVIGGKKKYLCPNCVRGGFKPADVGPDGYPLKWNVPLPFTTANEEGERVSAGTH